MSHGFQEYDEVVVDYYGQTVSGIVVQTEPGRIKVRVNSYLQPTFKWFKPSEVHHRE